jgi:hypothetical protein
MNSTRSTHIRNILTKYSLFKRALNRLQAGEITNENFILWTKEFIKSKHKSFLSLPVCEHNFGQYFTELYTKVKQIQNLTPYAKTYCTFNFYKLRNYILDNLSLTEKLGDIMIFLLILTNQELKVMGFITVTTYKRLK